MNDYYNCNAGKPRVFDARENGAGVVANTITGDHEGHISDYTCLLVLNRNRGGKMWKYWNGDQTAGTLSVRNAGGGQRMPDKEQFNCVVSDSIRGNRTREVAGTLDANYYKGCGERQGTEREIVGSETKDGVYAVRRLTPTECARLQGFPDRWGWPDILDDMDDETFGFWKAVRQTYDSINGRKPKDYAKKQILTWYSKLHTDSAEYKMWGNGIALPTALYVMQGIADELGEAQIPAEDGTGGEE